MSAKRTPAGCMESLIGADYTDEERNFLVAVDRYKIRHHRVYLTCRETLDILHSLGYRRVSVDPEIGSDNV